MTVALFRKKPPEDEGNGGEPGKDDFQPQPEKARQWFNHAQAMADSFNLDSALFYYASGIKLDPESIHAHEAMYEIGLRYMSKGGKPATGKEVRSIEDGSKISRFAAAEFAWMKDVANPSQCLKALEAAVKADQHEVGHWMAERLLPLLRKSKKPSKGPLLAAKRLFVEVHAWDQAIEAANLILAIDPTDAEVHAEMNDLAAQRAMDKGGYEQTSGEEGGFRRFIKDADKQRELEEAESIAGGVSIEERNLERARADHEREPKNPEVINRYAQLLRRQETAESREKAYEVYMAGYEATGEYRFRMNAGDIHIENARRATEAAKAELEAAPEDEARKQAYEEARREQLALEEKEYTERVSKYPTDLQLRFRLGEVNYALGHYEDAMGCFQKAKEESKLRVRSGHLLGRCFAMEGWHAEAIAEFREALDAIEVTEKERELAIRYDLMSSLIEQAREDSSLELARDALDICSGIARKDITYRDIRNKRKEIDALVKDLSG